MIYKGFLLDIWAVELQVAREDENDNQIFSSNQQMIGLIERKGEWAGGGRKRREI